MEKDLLDRVHKLHFVGIGGSGMCPIAEILHSEGYELTGSDVNEGDTVDRIRSYGIPVAMGHRAENIGDAEAVVYTAAVHMDNPELQAAAARGIPLVERSEMLGMVSARYPQTIGVAGTHGKTTTTSMITEILLAAQMDPTVVIGGKLKSSGVSGRVGHSDVMVCEACEFADTFLHLHPAIAVILNIDNDHLEYFGTVENTIKHFHQYGVQTSRMIVVNGDDAHSMQAVEGLTGKEIVTFGLGESNEYTAVHREAEHGAFAAFDLMHRGQKLAHIELQIPGLHNVYNALAAAAVADKLGIAPAQYAASLHQFEGARRRFEILGRPCGITIADDYAHHPTELAATLTAAKELGFHAVWAVFQPFTFSRTKMLMDDFARVLPIADHVVMTEIMGSRETNTYGVYTADLAAKIPGSVWFPTKDEVADYVAAHAQPGDLVITLGCGDIYKAAKRMLRTLTEKEQAAQTEAK